MNSTCDTNVTNTNHYDKEIVLPQSHYDTTPQTPITFEYTLSNTNIRMKRTISPLTSLTADLFNWITEFRDLVRICKWNEQCAKEVLRGLLSYNLNILTQSKENCETIMDELLRCKYPKTDSFYYGDKLNRIKQQNYILIKEYYEEITEITRRLSITQNMNQK
ncbi:hypothetical protein H311_05024, partial [Anncaliia algerae PRA109]